MRILIVEDERPTAEDIRFLVKRILKSEASSIQIETRLDRALAFLEEHAVDVLLLDLNLNAEDGFEILRRAASGSFHTIVISGNVNRAIEAYEYGVLDFIPKPYSLERLRTAFDRLRASHAADGHAIRYLSVKNRHHLEIVQLSDVVYFKAANVYTELHLRDGRNLLYDKSLKRLGPLLPAHYLRIHKSYIVDAEVIESIETHGGGHYRVALKTAERLPVSRQKIGELRKSMGV